MGLQEEDEQPIPPVKLRIKMGRGRKPKDASDAEAATPALAAVSRLIDSQRATAIA